MKKNARRSYNSIVNNYNAYKKEALKEALSKEYYEDNVGKSAKESALNGNMISFGFIIIFVICCSIPPLFVVAIIGLFIYLIVKFIKGFKNDMNKGIVISNLLVISIVSIFMVIYILVANLMYRTAVFGYLLLLLEVICLAVWFAIPSKKTYNGALAYKKWKALEKFLKDFGSFADKEVPEVALWEKYLVFATLFGCAKEVSKVMDMRFKEYNMDGMDYYDSWVTNYYINDLITSSVRNSVVSAQSAKAASESSSSSGSWSSGSGGGGGFSSGGGSFGGGGGGGRF